MTDYVATFEDRRIGRRHDVEPMTFVAVSTPDELAELIYQRAKPYLMSREVEVVTDLDEMRGYILVGGFRPVGAFTITERGTDA